MDKEKIIKKLLALITAMGITSDGLAAGFQLWSQDAGSIGNYHAGRAAIADDASTNFYNPAGLVRIHNQQLYFGLTPAATDVRFRGTVATNTLGTGPQPLTAQGGTFYFLPNLHYAAPLADNLVFGLSVMTPFGAQTNYGLNTNARYASALSSIYVVDVAPSLGFAYNNKISVGFGIDIEKAYGELSFMTTSANPSLATWNKNTGSSYGYGYHTGVLYQPTEQTRIGFNYLSQVVHHLHGGSSYFAGPLANNGTGGAQYTNNLSINGILPPTTTFSIFHTINPTWDVMGTVIYTQWNLLDQLILQNMTGISGGASSNSITMVIPAHYRNTCNYSLGANYHINEQWFIRTGLGYDETPSNNQYRNLQFPDGNQAALAFGTHFQATETIGFDLGWTHFFAVNTRINNLSQASGDQITVTDGSVHTSADVYGLEMKWDIL